MSDDFDAYRKWLGIPPEEQPPNHYRLLGIAVFEDDPDVIENAVNRQMAHVRTFQTGKHSKLSQEILNEISSAKICLLNDDKKAAYDEKLKAEIKAAQPSSIGTLEAAAPPKAPPSTAAPPPPPGANSPQLASPPPIGSSVPTGVAVAGQSPAASVATAVSVGSPRPVVAKPAVSVTKATSPTSTARRARARRKSSPWPLVLGVVGIAALVAVVIWIAKNNKYQPVDSGSGQGSSGSRPLAAERPVSPVYPTDNSSNAFPPPSNTRPKRTEPDDFQPSLPQISPPRKPEPSSPDTVAASQGQVRELLEVTIRALRNRDPDGARQTLARVDKLPVGTELKGRLDSTLVLFRYYEDFVNAVDRGLLRAARVNEFEERDSFEFEGKKFKVIEFDRRQPRVTFRFGDQEFEQPVRNLAPEHAMAFASIYEPFQYGTAQAKVRIAAFLGLDEQASADLRRRAKSLLKEAAELGLRDEHVAALLELPLDELPRARELPRDMERSPEPEPEPVPTNDRDDDPFGLKKADKNDPFKLNDDDDDPFGLKND